MKKIMLALATIGVAQLSAQELPVPSPAAKLEQRVGLTDFTIEYSRPSARDREIFGGLVPYEQLWRTGANKSPTISFNSPVNIGGEVLEPGTYTLLTIPYESHWVVIFNSNTEMYGISGYSEDQDVMRTEAMVEESQHTETFTINIHNLRTESADLVLEWAEVKVKVPMELEVHEQAMANIENALRDEEANKGEVYRKAAGYYHNNNLDSERALEYINNALAEDDSKWYAHWLKAQIHADMNDYERASEAGRRAIEAGRTAAEEEGNEFGYAEMIKKNMKAWEEKKKS